MDRIFELYDCIVHEHVSYHKTLEGALTAMSDKIIKLNPALCRDYEDDPSVDFVLKYQVKSHVVAQ